MQTCRKGVQPASIFRVNVRSLPVLLPTPAPSILVATDFSPASVDAFAYAQRLAAVLGAEVRLLHVLVEPSPGPAIPEEPPQDEASATARALDALRQLAASHAPSSPCFVRRGWAPAVEIVDEAREIGAETIVLGMCGQRPERMGLGAVSGEVIQTAPCDVILVPERAGSPFATTPLDRILVPVDFSAASAPLLALGGRLAEALDAHLDVVHVLEPLPHPVRWLDETFVDLVPQIRERAGTALQDLVEASGLDAERMTLYVERGKAAPSIPRVAEALGTDLILLGPHAERPVFDRLLGSVAEGVARRAACPVYIARSSAAPEGPGPAFDSHRYEATV